MTGYRKLAYFTAQLAATVALGFHDKLAGDSLSTALMWCAVSMAGGSVGEWMARGGSSSQR